MSSGEPLRRRGQAGEAAAAGGRGRGERDHLGAAEAVPPAGAARTREPFGGARSGALAAVEAAAAVAHRRLAAAAARPRARPATGRGGIVAGGIAVVEAAA